MMNSKSLLSVVDLRKTFELHLLGGMRMVVLDGVSFDVEEGEFGIIAGPSGSGKTTVLKCIYRSYLPTGGAIYYRLAGGKCLDLARCPERDVIDIRRREIACVTQFLRCAPRVPAEEIVASPRIGQGVDRTVALEEARDLLKRFRIPEKLWMAYPVTFSGGEQQRVNLARAIIQRPRLLLLDEPTASLDTDAIHLFLEALQEVRRKGTTCLAVFHDQLLVNTLATRLIELNGGRNAIC